MLRKKYFAFAAVALVFSLAACGGSNSNKCTLGSNAGCDSGQFCELVQGGGTNCFDPVLVRGKVFDFATSDGIQGARVVARDANSSVASTVATTDANGDYELKLSATRDSAGNPVSGQSFTLRADGAGYQTFPGGVRQALPISIPTAAAMTIKADQVIVDTALTDIALIELEPGAGTADIFGNVELPDNTLGALVVAELSSTEGYTAIADREGEYRIFNLPAGSFTVTAYAQDTSYDSANVTLGGGDTAEVDLVLNNDATASLTGKVEIVNAPGGSATSVILVVESTFDENLIRGETPPGLRAPTPGTAPNIDGAFTIDGIPAGNYVILAGFENDGLVRDPDTCIAGTDIIHQAFSSGESVNLTEGFKITGAIGIVSPGPTSVPVAVSSATPTLTWVDDSGEDHYEIVVFDSLGNMVWESTAGKNDESVVYDYDGTADPLQTGMYYQFRVTSISNLGCELSTTEDLLGVFYRE